MSAAGLHHFLRLIAACWYTFALTGCDRSPAPAQDASVANLRIVSLSPAMSRILCDLGLADKVVGRTQFCRSIDSAVPVVGDHFTQDLEMLLRLNPTHILLQPPRGEVAPALMKLADEHDWRLIHAQINSIDDVRALVKSLPAQLVPDEDARRSQLNQASHKLVEKMDAALQRDETSIWSGQILIVYSTDPSISLFGSSTYLDEVVRNFGCENAASHISGWGQVSLEDVVRMNPEAMLLIDEADRGIDAALGPLRSLAIEAIRAGRVGLITHPDALLPSTSVIEVAEEIHEVLREFVEPPQ